MPQPSRRSFGRRMPRLSTSPTEMAYIVTPYSAQSGINLSIGDRYLQAIRACAVLSRGYVCYSPIVMNHPIAVEMKLPTDAEYWWSRNKLAIDRCDLLIAVVFDGFENSRGCQQEIQYARSIKRKIWFVTPHELGVRE